jgi:hypothetical protein
MAATAKMKSQESKASTRPTKISEKLLKFMKEECVLVKGIFKNYECPGATVPFTQSKYPYHPEINKHHIFQTVMTDGEEYEIPLWVARWLNGTDVTAVECDGKIGSCSYPKHTFSKAEDGVTPISMPGKRVDRYGFQSLAFGG